MRKKNKITSLYKNKGLSLRKNKRFFGIFTILFTLVIIVGATLAWSSYSEWVGNHFQTNPEDITVKITEKFEQNSVMSFEQQTEKSVKVKNMSDRKAIIRVKFDESLLPFELNMTDGEGQGNANLKTVIRNKEKIIDIKNIDTWEKGSLLDSGLKENGNELYYVATDTILKNIAYTGETNRVNSARPTELSFFNWTFNTELYDVPQVAKTTPYWVFDGTYFYYSRVLEGGETTTIDLLQSVTLSSVSIPNKYKNALYDIGIQAEGVEASTIGVQHWTSDPNFLVMYQEDSKFN